MHVHERLEIHLLDLEGGSDGLDIERVFRHPARFQGMPLGDLDAAQPGGCFDTQVEAGAPALDEEGQSGSGLEARVLREQVVYVLMYSL